MKKNTSAVIIALIVGIVIGAVGYYIYYESQMSEAEKAVRKVARGGKSIDNDIKNTLDKIGK